MKTIRKTKSARPLATPFVRSEFELLASLLEDEAQGPLAKTNSRYLATLTDLLERVNAVGTPNNEYLPTDSVAVR